MAVFSAYLANGVNGVTGDGTFYVVPWDTTVIDSDTGMNTTTGVYTVATAGDWLLTCGVNCNGFLNTHLSSSLFIRVNGGNLYQMNQGGGFNSCQQNSSPASLMASGSIILPLAVNDTVEVVLRVLNSTKEINIPGSLFSSFCGATQ